MLNIPSLIFESSKLLRGVKFKIFLILETPSAEYIIKYDESPGRVISKHDLGEFLVKSLDQPEHYQKMCGIATKTTK